MPRYTHFGERYTRTTGAVELMSDLGDAAAAAAHGPVYLLGGGNPARIPAVETVYRRRLAEIAADTTQFGRFAGAYTEPAGHPTCRAAIAEVLQAEYGWPLEARNVALTAGSQSAFYVLFNLFAGRGADGARQRVLLPLAPEYIGYSGLNMQDDLVVAHPAVLGELPDGMFKYRLDFEQLQVPDDVGAICVSRPTNPSGNVLTTSELERLDLLAQRHRVPLMVDAAYGKPFPGIEFTDSAAFWNDNVVLCLSLSKLGLPGVRTGIVVAHESIIEAITAFNATAALAPPGTGAEIVAPLLASGELSALCNDVVRPFYRARCAFALDVLRETFAGLPLRIHVPEGAFFLWLWFQDLPISSAELYRRLKRRGVYVISGHHFFPGLDRDWHHRDECVRINYAQEPEMVREGIRLLAAEVARAYDERG
jgi:valine--pyruvate aminotransferase